MEKERCLLCNQEIFQPLLDEYHKGFTAQKIIDIIEFELTNIDEREKLWEWFNSKTLVGGMILDNE